jgi:inorganic pyrophosphatase
MAHLAALDPELDVARRTCRAVIETPRGRRTKFKYEADSGIFQISHLLPEGMIYPLDFGFIPRTRAEDGDPLDVMVLSDEPLSPGVVAPVRLIGVLQANQTEAGKTLRNDRLLAAAQVSRLYAEMKTPDDLGEAWLKSVEAFWVNYNALRGRQFESLGAKDGAEAARMIERWRV